MISKFLSYVPVVLISFGIVHHFFRKPPRPDVISCAEY